MKFESNRTTINTSKLVLSEDGTDRHFFIVVLGLGEANKHAKKNPISIGEKNIRKSLRQYISRILRT